MVNYSASRAEDFWTRRVKGTNELAAVLSYGLPDEINEAYSHWEITSVLNCLPPLPGRLVLDLACGVGRVTVPLAEGGARVTAVDNSQEMLNRCQNNVLKAGLAQDVVVEKADATALTYPDGSFDVVICLGLLEHLPLEPCQKAVLEIARVTKPGGVAVLIINNGSSVFLGIERRYKEAEQRDDGYFCGIVDRNMILEIMANAGFNCKSVGSNMFQSIAKHLSYQFIPAIGGESVLRALFAFCTDLDLRYRDKGDLDASFADQFLIKAEKVCAL
jgi:2-polyprenyl-3-methyl-5-hydroxy-6-metoxy-1,4-benzoquinol methylase